MDRTAEAERGARIRRIAAGSTLSCLALLGLGACGDHGSADKAAATPAASATASPGPQQNGSSSPSAATVQATPGGDRSPELQALAAELTPEKLRVLSPEQLKSALSVHFDALDKTDPVRSYLEHYAVLVEAADRSGMTLKDWAAAVPNPEAVDYDAYFAYVNRKYADVFAPQLWGTNQGNYKFYDGLHQNYLNATGGFAGYDGAPGGYALHVELEPSTIKVIDEGDGKTDAFTVEAGFRYQESYDREAIEQVIGAVAEPLNDTITMVFHDVVDGGDGVIRPSFVENTTE